MYYGTRIGMDPTYFLVLIGLLLSVLASALVKSRMNKYARVRNYANISGAEAARRILANEGLYDVRIECLAPGGGDHYDPSAKAVRLSAENYNNPSITAVSVAAHECGHAIQHARDYAPLSYRTALLPIANIGSKAAMPLILVGLLIGGFQPLIQIGIWAFGAAVLFQFITLPIEFNASARALQKVEEYGLLTHDEKNDGRKVLTAAALTYVAAAASALLQLLRLWLLFSGNDRRRSR